jgi:hypothetical protein
MANAIAGVGGGFDIGEPFSTVRHYEDEFNCHKNRIYRHPHHRQSFAAILQANDTLGLGGQPKPTISRHLKTDN